MDYGYTIPYYRLRVYHTLQQITGTPQLTMYYKYTTPYYRLRVNHTLL